MKIRKTTNTEVKIELQMTPMIDIVFQLLVFFIMTFKIAAQEGDFSIKMPLAAPSEGQPDPTLVPPIKLRLTATSSGGLGGMRLNEQSISSMDALRTEIINIIGDERGPGSIQETAEVELDCDYNLDYSHTIDAITAVSGYVGDNNTVVKLIEKIKFSPPKAAP